MVTSIAALSLANLSGADFREIARTNPVILLPLGSHEDHGPYLPMGDHQLAETLAIRVASACHELGTPAFVAPTLPFGVADFFGSSPGGMAVSAASFRAVLTDMLAALLRHNLTRVVILNGHGGNVPVIHEVTLGIKLSSGPIIPSLYLWKICRILMQRQLGDFPKNRFGHGAEPLLSLSKALRPDFSPPNTSKQHLAKNVLELPVSDFGSIEFDGVPIEVPVEFADLPQAVIEDARPLATSALGEAVANEFINLAANFIVHYASITTKAYATL
jgi:creatinine amidohydrolase